jgi:predicted DNA-binding transcriptional regulator AlpA
LAEKHRKIEIMIETVENPKPLLLSAEAAARLIGIGRSLFWSMHSAGKVPLPVGLGKRRLWRRAELEKWVDAGCPERVRWAAMSEEK